MTKKSRKISLHIPSGTTGHGSVNDEITIQAEHVNPPVPLIVHFFPLFRHLRSDHLPNVLHHHHPRLDVTCRE